MLYTFFSDSLVCLLLRNLYDSLNGSLRRPLSIKINYLFCFFFFVFLRLIFTKHCFVRKSLKPIGRRVKLDHNCHESKQKEQIIAVISHLQWFLGNVLPKTFDKVSQFASMKTNIVRRFYDLHTTHLRFYSTS